MLAVVTFSEKLLYVGIQEPSRPSTGTACNSNTLCAGGVGEYSTFPSPISSCTRHPSPRGGHPSALPPGGRGQNTGARPPASLSLYFLGAAWGRALDRWPAWTQRQEPKKDNVRGCLPRQLPQEEAEDVAHPLWLGRGAHHHRDQGNPDEGGPLTGCQAALTKVSHALLFLTRTLKPRQGTLFLHTSPLPAFNRSVNKQTSNGGLCLLKVFYWVQVIYLFISNISCK